MTHVCINIHHLEDDLLDMMESGLFLVKPDQPPSPSIRTFVHNIITCRVNPLFRL